MSQTVVVGVTLLIRCDRWVQADLGNLGVTMVQMTEAPVTVKGSVAGLVAPVSFAISVLPLVDLAAVLEFSVFCRSIKPRERKYLIGS